MNGTEVRGLAGLSAGLTGHALQGCRHRRLQPRRSSRYPLAEFRQRRVRDVAHERHHLDRWAEVEQNLLPWLGWFFRGTGDFNRDGYPDFLIYHPESGHVSFGAWSIRSWWPSTGDGPASSGELGMGDPRDRRLRSRRLHGHPVVAPASGDVSVWFMNGFTRCANSPVVNRTQFTERRLGSEGHRRLQPRWLPRPALAQPDHRRGHRLAHVAYDLHEVGRFYLGRRAGPEPRLALAAMPFS